MATSNLDARDSGQPQQQFAVAKVKSQRPDCNTHASTMVQRAMNLDPRGATQCSILHDKVERPTPMTSNT